MVVGNLLVGRRVLFLDYLSVGVCAVHDERCLRGAAAAIRQHTLVDVFLWRDVGRWRTYLRVDYALPRNVAGHGGGTRLLRGVFLQTVYGTAHTSRNRNSASGQVITKFLSYRAKINFLERILP